MCASSSARYGTREPCDRTVCPCRPHQLSRHQGRGPGCDRHASLCGTSPSPGCRPTPQHRVPRSEVCHSSRVWQPSIRRRIGRDAGCGTCADLCPAGAIPLDHLQGNDNALCIGCMKCVSVCPVHARSIGPTLDRLVARLEPLCRERKGNEMFKD